MLKSNGRTLRFKPPYEGMGWRVEIRPADVQLTDEENALFIVFM
jgi:glutamate--cysteine ligase catalytic subunit